VPSLAQSSDREADDAEQDERQPVKEENEIELRRKERGRGFTQRHSMGPPDERRFRPWRMH
jgi:hypothetical protein